MVAKFERSRDNVPLLDIFYFFKLLKMYVNNNKNNSLRGITHLLKCPLPLAVDILPVTRGSQVDQGSCKYWTFIKLEESQETDY